MVVHDFGGPIGLPFVIEHPDCVARIVLFNTWLWSLNDDRRIMIGHRFANGFLGRLFYQRLNGSPKWILKSAWADQNTLTDLIHDHYLNPFPTRRDRIAPWVLARELVGSSSWYDIWWRRRASIADIPALILWGLADPAFGESYLNRWEQTMTNATVTRLHETGHFVPDEASDRVVMEISSFLAT